MSGNQNLEGQKLDDRQTGRLLSGILDVSFEAIITIDSDYIIEIFNKGAERIFGYQAAEAVGQPLETLIPERFRANHGEHMMSFRGSSQTSRLMDGRGEIRGLRKDGEEFPAEASISRVDVDEREFFTVVLRDVTRRHRMEAELTLALKKSNEASQTKSEFLANMSHELRTPLNAIIGFSEMISLEMFGPLENERYLNYIQQIYSSGNHLLSLVNDILDLSKVESGTMQINEEQLDIADEIAACLLSMDERADKAGIVLEMNVSEGLPKLLADRRGIKQIILNLLSNAIKFTRSGGVVGLSALVDEDGRFVIRVSDTGIGISEENLQKLTTPFSQVESTLSREFSGTGLGLPLVRSLAGLHSGSLKLESRPGVGTVATIYLPAERVVAEEV